jgi:hypothetical protein
MKARRDFESIKLPPKAWWHELRDPLMAQELAAADWLEELAVYATPRRFQDAETAYHLSVVIRHWYLVTLALNLRSVRQIQ